jgi:hypothetical protein
MRRITPDLDPDSGFGSYRHFSGSVHAEQRGLTPLLEWIRRTGLRPKRQPLDRPLLILQGAGVFLTEIMVMAARELAPGYVEDAVRLNVGLRD